MTNRSTEARISAILLTNIQKARSGVLKCKIGLAFKILATRMGREFVNLREFNRILQLMTGLITEASVEVRNSAKNFFREINSIIGPEMAKFYRRVLSYE